MAAQKTTTVNTSSAKSREVGWGLVTPNTADAKYNSNTNPIQI
ncbi:hypothetical protein N9I32_01020 [Porticoccaceae bacterium]|nr:hypothetical protein [Porticoccaceae bacterium]MDA8943929.1 hypothetical protein [Porticoccaceae bacterium]